MMEVVIVDDGNRLTVYELVESVIPCIIAKHYSENYIQGFRSTFRNLLAYCNKNEKKYFTAELAQQTTRAERIPEYGQTRETWSEYGGTTLQP